MTNNELKNEITKKIAELNQWIRDSRANEGRAVNQVARTDRSCCLAEIRGLEWVLENLEVTE